MTAIWSRQPGETAPQWEAFQVFRDLGVLRERAEVQRRTGRSQGVIHKWSASNQWQARAEAFDRHQDEARQRQRIAEALDAERRHAILGKALLAKVGQLLATLDPAEIPKSSIQAYLKAAVDIERLSLGLDTARTSSTVSVKEDEADQDALREVLEEDPDLRSGLVDLAHRVAIVATQPGEPSGST